MSFCRRDNGIRKIFCYSGGKKKFFCLVNHDFFKPERGKGKEGSGKSEGLSEKMCHSEPKAKNLDPSVALLPQDDKEAKGIQYDKEAKGIQDDEDKV